LLYQRLVFWFPHLEPILISPKFSKYAKVTVSLIGFRDEKPGQNPMDRAKKGVKRSLLNEANAISTGLAIA
jgi:hypothetical protein